MNALLEKIEHLFTGGSDAPSNMSTRQHWDHLRENASSSAERNEIDAIFARQIDGI